MIKWFAMLDNDSVVYLGEHRHHEREVILNVYLHRNAIQYP